MSRTREMKIRSASLLLAALACGVACNAKTTATADGAFATLPGPQPTLPVAGATVAPPPISGGTLAVAADGRTAVAADSDRDRVYVVDVRERVVTHTVELPPGAEPGRVAIDGHAQAWVALRRRGSVVTIDLASGSFQERDVCTAPRGIAWDPGSDAVHIACADGDLVTIRAGVMSRTFVARDLRDVVVGTKLRVSRFRAAEVVEVDANGATTTSSMHGGNLGWRMAASPGSPDAPAMVSQEPVDPTGTRDLGYYGAGSPNACDAPTITATRLDLPGHAPIFVPPAVLPVDLATNGREWVIVAAGNGHTPSLPQIFVHRETPPPPATAKPRPRNADCLAMAKGFIPGQAVAAAFDGNDDLLVQSREPAALFIMSPDRQRVWKAIPLSSISREDAGHAIFHANSGGFLACASCHAEGGEDGRTWTFLEGKRRTPSMLGTVATTAPFHWDGAMHDLRELVDHVFTTRMSGPAIDDARIDGLRDWLFRLPAPARPSRPADGVARGEALFQARGCPSCHAGPSFTNNETHDVGTGGAFQVPSLVGVGWRPPFLHDGCARTLAERFDPRCGADHHGDTRDLGAAQIDDLGAFLETL